MKFGASGKLPPWSGPGGIAAVLALTLSALAHAQSAPEATAETSVAAEASPGPAAVAEPYPDTIPVPVKEDPPPPPDATAVRLDRVTVTAQKKVQLAADVPISMSVLDQRFLANWSITDTREAMLFVPNVKVEEAGFFASPRVRGFSFNNNNKAFEPPAGIALDGIPYTRVEYFNAALFDVGRIEVMRGPQGTTFGKNTTAGLINIISKNPSGKFSGFVDVQAGELDRRRVEAAVGGALVEGIVNFRVAGLYDDRDGFIHNTTAALSPLAAETLRGQSRKGGRAKLQFPDLFGSRLTLSAESVSLESRGAGAELCHASERMATVLRRYDPNVDLEKGNYTASIDTPDGRKVWIDTYLAEWNLPLGGWNIVALGGHSKLKNELDVDTDFSPAPAILGHDEDRSPTSTAELRAESPDFDGLFGLDDVFGLKLGSSNLLAGVFYQHRAIEGSGFRFRIGTIPFLELTVAGNQDEPVESLLNLLPQSVIDLLFNAIPASPPGSNMLYEEVQQGFDQDADSIAGFGQVQWKFWPNWNLQLAMRLTQEEKQATWNSVYTSPGPSLVLPLAGIEEFNATRETSEEQFQPKVSLGYQPTRDISLFLHWARAFKGGGFNAFAFRDVDDELSYGPEEAEEWGFDAKTTLFDGRAALNLSIYRLDINDFQVLTRIPDALTIGLGVTKVENAAQARAQGVEGDFTWLVTDWWNLIATVGINDTEYLDFKTNDCPADMDNTDGDGDERCDATGKPFAFAPKYNYTLLSAFSWPLTDGGLTLNLGLGAEYQSRQFLDIDLDERKTQEAFYRYRAHVGIGNSRQGWSFKIVGENLSDERTSIRQGDVVPGLFVSLQESPRQIYGVFRYSF